MSWLALELEIEGAAVEPLSEALLEFGADSVTIEEAGVLSQGQTMLLDQAAMPSAQRWPRNRICVIVDARSEVATLVRTAAQAAGLSATPAYGIHPLQEEDWVRRTQSQFGPLLIGERLWVVPTWCEPPRTADAVVLRLDPGLAFGTGSHPTTQLALTWLEQELAASRAAQPTRVPRVLDYGCGSGILALAAAKLGAANIVATDIDPQALATCAENAKANGVSIEILPPEQVGARHFDWIVANILARPLIELAPRLTACADAGTRIALSGILQDQAAEVIAAYADSFDLAVSAARDGWALLAGERR